MTSIVWKHLSALILLLLALGSPAAKAGDADELKALGFSPDGRYFAFEQWGVTEAGSYSITALMEVAAGRLVKGSRTTYSDEERKKLTKFRKATAKQIKKFKISSKDLMTVSVRGFDVEPFQQATVKRFALPSKWFGPESWLVLREFKLVTQRCKSTQAAPIGYGLALERKDAPTVQLSHDVSITDSRGCPTHYRIAEVHARQLKDGGAALAVMVQDLTPGSGGANRGFTAVTALVPAKAAVKSQ
jgi:predicted secreted protein